jgi:hypothetical protein
VTAEPEEPPDELLCVGGPYAGRRVQVRRHEMTVRMLAPISIEELDLSIQAALDGGPQSREMAVDIITYERVRLCEAHPGQAEPDRLDSTWTVTARVWRREP